MRALLLINPRAGNGVDARELAAEAERRGIDAHVLGDRDDAVAIARTADVDVLGVAGGDGSAGTVAGVAAERNLPLVVVPYGTRNHFARDLGLGRTNPAQALDAFAGKEQRVDLGRVGERRFLNNVSLGAYASLVHRRERHRRRREALAGVRALWLGRHRGVWAEVAGEPVRARVLLVANNAYELSLFSIGERRRLDSGRLHLYSAEGWLPRHWRGRSGERFTIDGPGPLRAAVDGEPAVLEPPLELAIEPLALRVLLPPGG